MQKKKHDGAEHAADLTGMEQVIKMLNFSLPTAVSVNVYCSILASPCFHCFHPARGGYPSSLPRRTNGVPVNSSCPGECVKPGGEILVQH